MTITSSSMFLYLPSDLQGSVASFLNAKDLDRLHRVSKRCKEIKATPMQKAEELSLRYGCSEEGGSVRKIGTLLKMGKEYVSVEQIEKLQQQHPNKNIFTLISLLLTKTVLANCEDRALRSDFFKAYGAKRIHAFFQLLIENTHNMLQDGRLENHRGLIWMPTAESVEAYAKDHFNLLPLCEADPEIHVS